MTRASRTSALGLLRRHVASGRGPAVLLAVLVGAAVLIAALIPRALVVLSDAELRHELTTISPVRADVSATGAVGYLTDGTDPGSVEELYGPSDYALDQLPASLPSPLGDIMGAPSWLIEVAELDVEPLVPTEQLRAVVTPTIDLDFASRITYVAGGAPAQWAGQTDDDTPTADRPPIDIVLSSSAADELGVELDDLMSSRYAPLRVAGIFEARDPDDPYWLHAPDLLEPATSNSLAGVKLVAASAYIDPLSAVGLSREMAYADLSAWYPADVSELTFEQVEPLLTQLREASTRGLELPYGERLAVQTGLISAMEGVIRRVTATTALLALAGSAPLGVVFAALALGVRAVIDRRRPALALASARGASGLQLRGVMLLEGLLITVPTTALAAVVAVVVVPGAVTVGSIVPPLVIALVVPVLFAITTSRRSIRPVRMDLGAGGRPGNRWVVEVVIVGLAALSVFLLSRRGLFTSSDSVGVDPLLAATPLLLSLAICVLVLRLYPLPLLALQRRTHGRRGAVELLGVARAVRDPSTGFGSVLALVVGASAAVFSVVIASTLGAAVATGARAEVGADIRVRAALISDEMIGAIGAIPGVTAVAPLQQQGAAITFGFDEAPIVVLLADSTALHTARPELPALPDTGTAVPFLASESVSERLSDDLTELDGSPAERVATIGDDAIPGIDGPWVLIDARDVGVVADEAFAPQLLLISVEAGADAISVADAVREVAGEQADVLDTAGVLAAAASRPTTGGVQGALGVAALLSLALALLTIVLGSIAGAAARSAMVGILRVLGMSPRQISALVAWEFVPVALAAVVTGTALGLVLPFVVTGVVDLRAFVGGSAPIDPVVPWPAVIAIALGFAVAAVLTSIVTAAISRRRDPAATLRIGGS